jgi:bilin biosynthesis protein
VSKDEIRNFLKDGKPNSAVKNYRKDAIPHLLKFLEDKDEDVQKNAIIAFGVAGKRIGVSKKDVESFIKTIDKFPSQFHSDVATAIAETGDIAILQLINLLSDRKMKPDKKQFILSLFELIGDTKVFEALLGEKITNPSEATLHELLLRTQTSLLENSKISTYDPNIDYSAQMSDFKKLISSMFSSKDQDDIFRALDACGHFPTIATEFSSSISAVIGKNQELTIKALQTLGELRNPASLSIITKHLNQSVPNEIRIAATSAIGTIGHESGVEPIIKHVLNTQDEYLRQAAVNALGKIGEPAAEELVKLLQNELFKDQVEIALKRVGEPAVKHLRRAMGSNNKNIRKNATDLAKLILTTKYGVGGTVLKLIEILSDRDEAVREQVVETIINMGDPGLENVIRAVVSQDKNIRENSIEILNRFALMNIQLVVEASLKKNIVSGAELLFLLGIFVPDEEVLDFVYGQLEQLNGKEEYSNAVKQAILDNIFVYNDLFLESDEAIKFNMVQICGYLGKPVITHLAEFLSDKSDEVKEVAINSLGFIGPDAHVAINLLKGFAKHKNVALRKSTIKSLGLIADPSGVPDILEAMSDEDEEVQTLAQEAIDNIGVSSIPTLIDLLNNPGSNDKLIDYISNLEYSGLRAALIDRLSNDNANFHDAVLKLIVKISSKYPEFKDYLLTEVRLSPNENVHIIGVRSFGALKFDPALPLLVDELLKENKKINQACMDAIHLGYGQKFVSTCLGEMEKGGSEIAKVCSNFLKSVDSDYTVVPLIENLPVMNAQKGVAIELLKKIGDKNISAKLSSVDDPIKYKKILAAEPDLAKIAEKISN